MRHFIIPASLTLAAAILTANPAISGPDPARGPVVVELFTSQGCSSCPSADAVLGELAARPDVLALSLPVDYWDSLGWKDTFARSEHTARQRAYAAKFRTNRVYTPQAIIDGVIDVVGSNRNQMTEQVNNRRALPQKLHMTLDSVDGKLALTIAGSADSAARGATIWIASYCNRGRVTVGRGENGGRTLDYWNVVTDLHAIGIYTGGQFVQVLADQPPKPGWGIAVIVQSDVTGPILASASFQG